MLFVSKNINTQKDMLNIRTIYPFWVESKTILQTKAQSYLSSNFRRVQNCHSE